MMGYDLRGNMTMTTRRYPGFDLDQHRSGANAHQDTGRVPMYVLSFRNQCHAPVQGCIAELEDVFVELTGAALLCPRDTGELASTLAMLPTQSADLFVTASSLSQPVGLLMEIRNWRRPFRRVFGYIFDPFVAEGLTTPTEFRRRISRFHRTVRQFDQLFVPGRLAVKQFADYYRVPVAYLPIAADVRQFGSMQSNRPITVNAYGRQHPGHVEALSVAYNTNHSSRSLHHTSQFVMRDILHRRQYRTHFWKILTMSCITLAYDLKLVDPDERRLPFSIVAQRWFEGLAAGCVVVGYRPRCPEADEILTWKDATLECPEDPGKFLQFIDDLLSDPSRLETIRISNFTNMLHAHDWGYRIVEMFAAMAIQTPAYLWARRHKELMRMLPQQVGVIPRALESGIVNLRPIPNRSPMGISNQISTDTRQR
jgi:Glycosyl transferases group 1